MSILSFTIFKLLNDQTKERFINFLEGNPDRIVRDNLYTIIYTVIFFFSR